MQSEREILLEVTRRFTNKLAWAADKPYASSFFNEKGEPTEFALQTLVLESE